MKKSVLLKIIVGALLIPILSLFLISKFNFFSYFSFIPGDYQYEAGLGSYMFVLDVIYEYVVYHILRGQAKITFIMYKSECEINVNNTPTVVCSDNNYGVGSFNCNIKLEGNIKKLRRTRILLPLPPWLTYQIPKSDEIVSSTDDGIIWDFSNILPTNSEYKQNAECTSNIPLIKNLSSNSLVIKARPQLIKARFWDKWGIDFNSNEIII